MKKFGLIGFPLAHSFSKRFFTEKFEKEKINSTYENFEIDNIDKFPEIIKNNPELFGLNVTIPYKKQVLQFLDKKDYLVEKTGACNTIKIICSGEKVVLQGFNTDVPGFMESLLNFIPDTNLKALVLGSGGASKSVRFVLDELEISYLTVARKPVTGEISYETVTKEILDDHKLIINTTPLGTYPHVESFPLLPYEFLSSGHFLFDLVYNPELTVFMREGLKANAKVKNGHEMLIIQAEKSWEIWQEE